MCHVAMCMRRACVYGGVDEIIDLPLYVLV